MWEEVRDDTSGQGGNEERKEKREKIRFKKLVTGGNK